MHCTNAVQRKMFGLLVVQGELRDVGPKCGADWAAGLVMRLNLAAQTTSLPPSLELKDAVHLSNYDIRWKLPELR